MVAIPAIIEGAIQLAPLVEQAVSLAATLSSQATASGQMTAAQVTALWNSAQLQWDNDFAVWMKMQATKIPPVTTVTI